MGNRGEGRGKIKEDGKRDPQIRPQGKKTRVNIEGQHIDQKITTLEETRLKRRAKSGSNRT
eukprot:6460142-Karenia_brevis.AAC.1